MLLGPAEILAPLDCRLKSNFLILRKSNEGVGKYTVRDNVKFVLLGINKLKDGILDSIIMLVRKYYAS